MIENISPSLHFTDLSSAIVVLVFELSIIAEIISEPFVKSISSISDLLQLTAIAARAAISKKTFFILFI